MNVNKALEQTNAFRHTNTGVGEVHGPAKQITGVDDENPVGSVRLHPQKLKPGFLFLPSG